MSSGRLNTPSSSIFVEGFRVGFLSTEELVLYVGVVGEVKCAP